MQDPIYPRNISTCSMYGFISSPVVLELLAAPGVCLDEWMTLLLGVLPVTEVIDFESLAGHCKFRVLCEHVM